MKKQAVIILISILFLSSFNSLVHSVQNSDEEIKEKQIDQFNTYSQFHISDSNKTINKKK